jgi:hypothetical protein
MLSGAPSSTVHALPFHSSGKALPDAFSSEPATTTACPFASTVAVGYHRPARMLGAVTHEPVPALAPERHSRTSFMPRLSAMCPPGTSSWPSGRNVWPLQKMLCAPLECW